MTFAPDGSLWATNRTEGLFRIPHPGETSDVQQFRTTDGLTSDLTDAVFRDREGGIWVGTNAGLDHFYPSDVVAEERIPPRSRLLYGMLRDASGRIWIADSTTLYRIDPGGTPQPVRAGLGNPQALCQAADGAIWLADSTGVFRSTGGDFIRVTAPPGHLYFFWVRRGRRRQALVQRAERGTRPLRWGTMDSVPP